MTTPTPPPTPPPLAPASTSAAGPRPTAAFVAEWQLLVRSVATRGRVTAILVLAGLSILSALAVSAGDTWDTLGAGARYVNSNLTLLVPVAALVFGSATLGNLLDDGSLVYLWLRPVHPAVHVLAAWAATVAVLLPLVGAPVLLSTAMIDSDAGLLSATVIAGLLAIATYSALSVMVGVRFRRALVLGLAYILIWEGFIASAGETAARLAVRGYLRSILSDRSGVEFDLAVIDPTIAVLVPIAVTVLALAYATRRLANADIP